MRSQASAACANRRRDTAPQPCARRMAADEGAQRVSWTIRATRDDQAGVRFAWRRDMRQRTCVRDPSPVMRHGGRDAGKTDDVGKREALWQQRSDVVGVDGDERACGDGVVTPDGTTGQDGVDGQMQQARTMPAATAVGDGGCRAAQTSRIATIPPHQRATDSHDYTRWFVESIEHLIAGTRGAFK